MAKTFYWYDLETSGIDPKWDRIVQFAGMRTDEDLQPVADEYCTYVQLADDILPNPEASLVTGITPQLTHARGIPETEALLRINKMFAEPGTCVAGYNSLRFDDEFMRYGLYRNLLDPYAREWQQGNSRWDLIDLIRATGALRRDGIEWPMDADGLPVYKLEELTKANGISHGHAHDAMSDVHATIGLARLIKTQQPKLFDYYFELRRKKAVKALLEPLGARLCVHISGMYPRARYGVGPVISVAHHPTNSNSIIVADLGQDIEPLLRWSAEDLAENLFTKDAPIRPGLKEIRINRCPFVAPIQVLNDENCSRLEIDLEQIKDRAKQLKSANVMQKIANVYRQQSDQPKADVDAGLYDGFLQDEDRTRCQFFHSEVQNGRWREMDFLDERLAVLTARMKARSFPALLDQQEIEAWQLFVKEKLETPGAWLNLQRYESRLEELMLELSADPGLDEAALTKKIDVLQKLAMHAQDIRARYQL